MRLKQHLCGGSGLGFSAGSKPRLPRNLKQDKPLQECGT